MDPNETLRVLRVLMGEASENLDRWGYIPVGMGEDIVEHFNALDTWMASGGFKPKAWEADR